MEVDTHVAEPSQPSSHSSAPLTSSSQLLWPPPGDFQRLSDQLTGFQTHFDSSFGEFCREVYSHLNLHSGDLSYLSGRVDEMSDQMGRIEGQVTPLLGQFQGMCGQLNAVHKDVDDLREYTSSWDDRMTSLHTQIADTNANVQTLQIQWDLWSLEHRPSHHQPPTHPPE